MSDAWLRIEEHASTMYSVNDPDPTVDSQGTGVVLAGGYSERFGTRDKALAPVCGEPMLVRVVERVGAAVERVVVNCRRNQRDAFDGVLAAAALGDRVRFAVDPEPDCGPLAGFRSALERVDTDYAALVACDMPGVDPRFLDFLFECADSHDAAVPELPNGTFQPAQAVYRTEAVRTAAERLLSADRHSLRGTFEHLDAVFVSPSRVEEQTDWVSLEDINTRDALESFERDCEKC